MNNSNRKKRRNRAQVAQQREEQQFQDNGMAEHRGGTFRVLHRKTKEQRKGLSWKQAYELWHQWGDSIILEDS